jgi:N-methylhydantoinase B
VLDPVTYQVVLSRLSGIVREMQDSVFRTGYSTIIRESQDASCLILDARGDVVGEHVILPLHAISLPEAVRAVRRIFDDIAPGDAFITNHPYEGGVAHSMDMAVLTPSFVGETLVGFCGSIAHKSDLGGVIPGTAYANARELFQEGIQYPPVRYMRRGEIVRDVEAILKANSRTPELVLGDLRGQIGCARLGERRIADVADRYGIETLLAVFEEKQRRTEARVRAALGGWPDGVFEGESFIDHDGVVLDRPLRIHVRAEKRGDSIAFDFTESSDQTAGPLNIRPPLARGACYYAVIAMIDNTLSNDGGLARVVQTTFRPGSILDPRFPAPCNAYMTCAMSVTEAALQALSGFVPRRAIAGYGSEGAQSITGKRADGRPFVEYEFLCSGWGGVVGFDGLTATSGYLGNTRTAPIEVIETEFPTRIERFELVRDSGGPGKFRGGLAARRIWRVLGDDEQLTLRGGRHVCAAFGRDGGKPGGLGSCTLNAGTPRARSLPSFFSGVPLRRDDTITLESAGGGGLGDPRERPFERVVDDVIDGYVSPASAIVDYGVDPHELEQALAPWGGDLDTDDMEARLYDGNDDRHL